MTHVATLISNPATSAIDGRMAARVQTELPGALGVTWLDPGIAADIVFSPASSDDNRAMNRTLLATLRDVIGKAPIDVAIQPAVARRKRLLLADMDSTMIGQECIDELADHVGLKTHVAAITERAMRGEIAFVPALRERVALLKGLPANIVDDVIRDRITITDGARTLIATMRAHGAYTCLVSGGFKHFTDRIAAMIGFDENRSNRLLVGNDGRLTGEVGEPVFGSADKLAALVELRERKGLRPGGVIAVGDGANDLPMLEAAGLGVAYDGKPVVAAAADVRIDHSDLTALLYLQGYRREEFVSA
jgi:phosphoserine phosphatase